MSSKNTPVLQAEHLRKELQVGEVKVVALRDVSLSVARGEFVAVIGPSGSGKSTLLGLMGGLDTPTSGRIWIDGVDITEMNERALTRIRNEKIGFVFQSFNLIPTLTALENVALPVQFARHKPSEKPFARALRLLETLGLGDRLDHRPTQLSGGQQQRVAVARALANNPPLLLADEPTGNLDSTSSVTVLEAFRDIQRELGTTIIVVTHDMDVASQCDRIISLVDGEIVSDGDPRSILQRQAVDAYRQAHSTGEIPAVSVPTNG